MQFSPSHFLIPVLLVKQMHNFNRGRGTLAILNYSIFPLVVATASPAWLESKNFFMAVSILVLLISWKTFQLIRDYGKILFLVYGMYPGLVALVVLTTHSDISTFLATYPDLMVHFENQAFFVVSCVQFGFLLYYAYGRRLVSKEVVQELCKNYHPALFFVYVGSGLWRTTQHGGWSNSLFFPRGLPWPIVGHSILISLFGFLFAFKIVKTQFHNISSNNTPPTSSDDTPSTTRSSTQHKHRRRRRSSLFEAEGIQTRRRSSAFEQIAELDQLIAAVSSSTSSNRKDD